MERSHYLSSINISFIMVSAVLYHIDRDSRAHPVESHLFVHYKSLFARTICNPSSSIISPFLARPLIGYDKYPPLPANSNVAHSSYYLKLGQHVHYKRHIEIQQYDLNELSQSPEYCNGKLTPMDVREFLISCNLFHADNRLRRKAFRDYLLQILFKLPSFAFGAYALYHEKWLYDHSLFFADWPNGQGLDCCSANLKLLYFYHIGFYLFQIGHSLRMDSYSTTRSDFKSMLVHHSISLVLLIVSYSLGLLRIGAVVLLLHDPSDILSISPHHIHL